MLSVVFLRKFSIFPQKNESESIGSSCFCRSKSVVAKNGSVWFLLLAHEWVQPGGNRIPGNGNARDLSFPTQPDPAGQDCHLSLAGRQSHRGFAA